MAPASEPVQCEASANAILTRRGWVSRLRIGHRPQNSTLRVDRYLISCASRAILRIFRKSGMFTAKKLT